MTSRHTIHRALADALDDDGAVSVRRRSERGVHSVGSVLAVGRKWVLLARLEDGGHPEGLIAFRIDDIHSVRPAHGYEAAFARTLGVWPPAVEVPDGVLDRTRDLLGWMGREGTLIGIQSDHRYDAIWIGVLDEVRRHWVYLLEIDPEAAWLDAPRGYRLGRTTVVESGGRYLTALTTMAGPRPVR